MRAVVSAVSAEGQDCSPGQGAGAAVVPKLREGRRVGALWGCCSTERRPRNEGLALPCRAAMGSPGLSLGAVRYQDVCMCAANKPEHLTAWRSRARACRTSLLPAKKTGNGVSRSHYPGHVPVWTRASRGLSRVASPMRVLPCACCGGGTGTSAESTAKQVTFVHSWVTLN